MTSVLWVLAGLGVVWIVVPVVMFLLRRTTLRNEIVGDAESVLPTGRDRSYERAFRELTALGFAPAGSSIESGWFLTPMNWRKQFPRARWLASSDGRTFVSCYRVYPLEPVRIAVQSLNDRGGIMLTVAPGAKIEARPDDDDLHVEVPRGDTAALVARHEAEVDAFCQARNLSVVPATFAEMVEQNRAFSRRFLRKISGVSSAIPPLVFLLLPLLEASLTRRNELGDPALLILKGVGYFAVVRLIAVPLGLIAVALSQLVDRLFGRDR